jgi:3-phenylpropionate/cinnamic acid dioxygenase small subunit
VRRGGVAPRSERVARTNTRHVITTIAVEVEGSHAATARATAYWLFYTNTNEAPQLTLMGKYDDTYIRSFDGWQLDHRAITFG